MAHKNSSNISPYKTRRLNKAGGSKLGKHKRPAEIFSIQEANDRLYDIFKNHDFSHISHEVRLKLAQFYALLMEKQKDLNVTRLITIKDVAIKHFIDCLIIPQITELQFPLIDIGTGPGFPGIPLKFLYPKESIALAEGVQKRVEFLKEVREKMHLDNLPIFGRNINIYFAYPFKGVITRAVEDIENTLRNSSTCLQTGGKVYFMKGPNCGPEIQNAQKNMSEYFKLVQDTAYQLPQTQQDRRLIVFEKIKSTPLVDFDEEPWPED